MRLIVAGSRDFDDYSYMESKLADLLVQLTPKFVTIISGGARGADALGERYARSRGTKLKVMRADWDEHGKRAGIIRNEEMAREADALAAFWNGKSRGTKHMIQEALRMGLDVHVFQGRRRG
jgi:hypothetical protein